MKYFLPLLFVCITLSSLAQKKHSEQKVIEKTVHKFIKALYTDKYDDAKEFGTEETKKLLSKLKMVYSMMPDSMMDDLERRRKEEPAAKITINKFQLKEKEESTGSISFVHSVHPDREETIYLVKQNGIWLVDLIKKMPQLPRNLNK